MRTLILARKSSKGKLSNERVKYKFVTKMRLIIVLGIVFKFCFSCSANLRELISVYSPDIGCKISRSLISLRGISASRSNTAARHLPLKLEVITLISISSFIARTIYTLEWVKFSFLRKIQSIPRNKPTPTKELLFYCILKL